MADKHSFNTIVAFCILTNLIIVGLVGFALWFTHSLWVFLGLFFLHSMKIKPSTINTKCPECDYEFVAIEKDEDENEGEN